MFSKRRRAYIENVIQANEKALFTPEEDILKGQKEGTWESGEVERGKRGMLERWKDGKME